MPLRRASSSGSGAVVLRCRLEHPTPPWTWLAAGAGGDAGEPWRHLESLPYAEQLRAVESDPATHSWACCQPLLRMSLETGEERPERAAQLAELVIWISGYLGEAHTAEAVCDLQALGWMCLGNARRVLGELCSADDAFEAAQALRLCGTRDPWIEGQVLAFQALLRRDQRRLAAAVMLLDRVRELFRGALWPVEADGVAGMNRAEVDVLHGWCLYHLGHPEAAEPLLEEARHLVDESRQNILSLVIRCGVVWTALRLGNLDDAAVEHAAAVEKAESLGNEVVGCLLLRAQAVLHLAQGERGQAEQLLRQAAQGLARLGYGSRLRPRLARAGESLPRGRCPRFDSTALPAKRSCPPSCATRSVGSSSTICSGSRERA